MNFTAKKKENGNGFHREKGMKIDFTAKKK